MAESDSDEIEGAAEHIEKAALAMADGRDPLDTAGVQSSEEEWIFEKGEEYLPYIKERANEIAIRKALEKQAVRETAPETHKTKKGFKECPPGSRRNPKTNRCVKSHKPHTKKDRREEKERKTLQKQRGRKFVYPKEFLKKDGGIKKNCRKKAAAWRKAQDDAKVAQSKKKRHKTHNRHRHSMHSKHRKK